jgi:hypothetical protein
VPYGDIDRDPCSMTCGWEALTHTADGWRVLYIYSASWILLYRSSGLTIMQPNDLLGKADTARTKQPVEKGEKSGFTKAPDELVSMRCLTDEQNLCLATILERWS